MGHPTNRCVALYGDKFYTATSDARVVALDANTGAVVWDKAVEDYNSGYYMTIARLLEAYAEEKDLPFNGFGSWTLKNPLRARALEPDECYSLSLGEPSRPDLAIEVIWTSGGIDKLEVYRKLSPEASCPGRWEGEGGQPAERGSKDCWRCLLARPKSP